jgi:hypothetical protein
MRRLRPADLVRSGSLPTVRCADSIRTSPATLADPGRESRHRNRGHRRLPGVAHRRPPAGLQAVRGLCRVRPRRLRLAARRLLLTLCPRPPIDRTQLSAHRPLRRLQVRIPGPALPPRVTQLDRPRIPGRTRPARRARPGRKDARRDRFRAPPANRPPQLPRPRLRMTRSDVRPRPSSDLLHARVQRHQRSPLLCPHQLVDPLLELADPADREPELGGHQAGPSTGPARRSSTGAAAATPHPRRRPSCSGSR